MYARPEEFQNNPVVDQEIERRYQKINMGIADPTRPSEQLRQQFVGAATRAGFDRDVGTFQQQPMDSPYQTEPSKRGISAGHISRKASAEEATGELDEATRDLLRLSAEPISASARNMKKSIQKAASTSQMYAQQTPQTVVQI